MCFLTFRIPHNLSIYKFTAHQPTVQLGYYAQVAYRYSYLSPILPVDNKR